MAVHSAKHISHMYNNVVYLSLANTPGTVMWDGPSRLTHVSVEEDTLNVSDSQYL
jgi:alanine dehydrogenase